MRRIMVILAVLCFAANAWALSPPQYTLQRELAHSFGANPTVEVSEVNDMGNENVIYVKGSTRTVANALAFVLKPQHEFGGIRVRIEVQYSDGTPVSAVTLTPADQIGYTKQQLCNALRDNLYFVKISPAGQFISLFVEIKAEVIQFWNDSLDDLNENSNFVAAEVFRRLANDTYFNDVTVSFFSSNRF